jgi:hypothetical protein
MVYVFLKYFEVLLYSFQCNLQDILQFKATTFLIDK